MFHLYNVKEEGLGHIIALAVDSKFRRQHIATRLLMMAIRIFKNIDIHRISLEVKSKDMLFKTMMVLATEMMNLLRVKFPSSSIEDWQGYLVQRLSLMLPIYRTFSKVLLEDKDYITSNTILRMMADNLAITKFIYVDHKGEMRLLRHYLFLLDGSLTYLKITDSMNSNVLIIEEVENKLELIEHDKNEYKKKIDVMESTIDRDRKSVV